MDKLVAKLKKEQYKIPFITGIIVGLLTHMIMIVNKYPNSDSMTNFYFDQNMVTSGRWFLMVACGLSSFYDLNFVNGILAILFLAISAVFVTRFFDVEKVGSLIMIPTIMLTFPAVAATMSYMYTVDGYMIGLLLAILAAYLAKKYKFGFLIGGVLLAFSMGIYQAYIAFTILLVMFDLMLGIIENEKIKDLWTKGWKYLVMGIMGGSLYFVILKICLFVQHKELDTYQGLNEMGKFSLETFPRMIKDVYFDFAAFALRGRIFVNNGISMVAMCIIIAGCIIALCTLTAKYESYKKWYNWLLMGFFLVILPIGCNIILLMSSKAEYHLLMRMQWGLFLVIAVVLFERGIGCLESIKENMIIAKTVGIIIISIICYNFILSDNIAYFNLNERYEKTYAYCVRLLDRIEQTEGYYQGMPICMVGVVSDNNYPSTDITGEVTTRIRGTDGDFLLYKGEQYQEFMQHYLGATLNILTGENVIDMYYSDEYQIMGSFPEKDSIKIVDGIMYIKTENLDENLN